MECRLGLEALQNGVAVGASEAEAIHAHSSYAALRNLGPFLRCRQDLYVSIERLNLRIQLVEQHIRRDDTGLECQRRFDHGGQTCCSFCVTYDCLDRSDEQGVVRICPFEVRALPEESIADGLRFNGIASRCAWKKSASVLGGTGLWTTYLCHVPRNTEGGQNAC